MASSHSLNGPLTYGFVSFCSFLPRLLGGLSIHLCCSGVQKHVFSVHVSLSLDGERERENREKNCFCLLNLTRNSNILGWDIQLTHNVQRAVLFSWLWAIGRPYWVTERNILVQVHCSYLCQLLHVPGMLLFIVHPKDCSC